ncbi:hypothetical protein PR202_ga06008 [Eleusine coracana subsp. coracana]|uniref:Uncharacterized protein n=1 Tax=Eleusine coracana subsp. coracana TaxID=191504 RepID=A0AAV5BTW1_ELECO|nr:hypothetical protein QOZ80_5AG0362650 [Eleusine coracana subsp. coracana]GJM89788.1 hypothetical protein PR202_ga06008 [Eleusine coracana subsp. coracana]
MADDDEFTFAAVVPPCVTDDGGGAFLKGALYPVFGRPRSPPRPPEEPETTSATVRVPVSLGQLLLVDRDEPSPADELDSVPAEMYCPWLPGWSAAASPARCRKSGSTGSVLRWRPRLVGRSQSDGKEKFVFLNTSNSSASGSSRRKGRNGEAGGDNAWSYYAKGSGAGNGARRTSFLPYKQDLVGLFANAAVFRRSYHPF